MTNVEHGSKEASFQDVIRIDEAQVRGHVDQVVRKTVEQTLNGLLEAETDELCGAQHYERSIERLDARSGLPTSAIERGRVAGGAVGTRVSPSTVSELNQKIYGQIEAWRNRPVEGTHAYVYLDGIWLKRTWGGEVKNVAVLVAVGVREDGYREILGVMEGAKEDTESWRNFLRHLKQRGLTGVQLVISDKCLGLIEAVGEFYPEAAWQRCVVHFYRNVFTVVPKGKAKEVAAMLKAIHAQEDRAAAREKAEQVAAKLVGMRLHEAAQLVRSGVDETLSYMSFPREHWLRLRTNNMLERIMREIRRRTRVVGAFPDGTSALMLVAARLRHIAGTKWGTKRYLDMERLREPMESETPVATA